MLKCARGLIPDVPGVYEAAEARANATPAVRVRRETRLSVLRLDPLLADLPGDLGLVGHRLLFIRTRSLGTTRFSTTGTSSCRTTSCTFSEILGPESAGSTFGSPIGSRSTRTSSR